MKLRIHFPLHTTFGHTCLNMHDIMNIFVFFCRNKGNQYKTLLMVAKALIGLANLWLTPRTTEAQDFENENWKSAELLF